MSVYRPKKSPYYHYDFQHKGIRYYGATACISKVDARRVERDKRTEAGLGTKEKPSVTIDEGLGIFWGDKGTFEKARKTTEGQIGNLVRLLGGAVMLHDLDDISIGRMVARRRGENVKGRKKTTAPKLVSNATVNREVQLLKRAIRYLAGRYKVPAIDWTKHKLKEAEERDRHASEDEEERLLATLRAEDHDLADLVEFAILSGARKNAIVTLTWSNVDLKARTAKVRTKGDVWHSFPLSTRMIEIIANRPKAGPMLFTYVCKRPAPKSAKRPNQVQRIAGERYPFSKQGWDRRWRRLRAAAGLEDFRFHDLRHTAGTRLTKQSNLKVAQKMLGHTRIETTARYAHVGDDDMRLALEKVELSRNSPGHIPDQPIKVIRSKG